MNVTIFCPMYTFKTGEKDIENILWACMISNLFVKTNFNILWITRQFQNGFNSALNRLKHHLKQMKAPLEQA